MKDFSIVLASGSRYRRELLERLGLPFTSWSPELDESPLPGEAPRTTAGRLALAKARAGAARFPDAWIIGSDQVADLDGAPLGKPVMEAVKAQPLRADSGPERRREARASGAGLRGRVIPRSADLLVATAPTRSVAKIRHHVVVLPQDRTVRSSARRPDI